jgi:hypothetical protein
MQLFGSGKSHQGVRADCSHCLKVLVYFPTHVLWVEYLGLEPGFTLPRLVMIKL